MPISQIEWEEYLTNLSKRNIDEVRRMWNNIVCEVPDVRIPEEGILSPYTKSFCFEWNDNISYLSIEFSLDIHQEIEWVYINSLTGEIDGSTEPSSYLTRELTKAMSWCALEQSANGN